MLSPRIYNPYANGLVLPPIPSTMATAITTALSAFAQAITNVGFAVLNAALAVFHAILALFQEIATGVLSIAQAVVKLFTDLVQDTLGFVFGEPTFQRARNSGTLTTSIP